ncbi:Ig-like domain-containing protein [Paenibacillus phytohabitans]|nr:Ig-like domain-containing protein [Paenibacillus phytohabitans]
MNQWKRVLSSFMSLAIVIGMFTPGWLVKPATVLADSAPASNTLSLSGDWDYKLGGYESLIAYSSGGMKLPGTLDESKIGNPVNEATTEYLTRYVTYSGKATYKKTIMVPAAWDGSTINLYMERTKATKVFIDGQNVGLGENSLSLSAAHSYDLTAFLKPGQSQMLEIEVDNLIRSDAGGAASQFPASVTKRVHMVSENIVTNWNGIIGQFELQAKPKIYIKDVAVYPDVPNQKVQVRVVFHVADNAVPSVVGNFKLNASSSNGAHFVGEGEVLIDGNIATPSDPRGDNVPANLVVTPMDASRNVVWTFNYNMGSEEEIQLWNEFNPSLYDLTADLSLKDWGGSSNEEYKDSKTISFGMRTLGATANNRQFTINGEAAYMRGEASDLAFPLTGYPSMDVQSWKKVMQVYKDYGLNWIRFHSSTPPEAAFTAADELGIYLQPELPAWGDGSTFVDNAEFAYYKNEAQSIFRAYANHPSFVGFTLGNENKGSNYNGSSVTTSSREDEILLYIQSIDNTRVLSRQTGKYVGLPPATSFIDDYIADTGSGADIGTNLRGLRYNNLDWDYQSKITNANGVDLRERIPAVIMSHELGQYQVFPDYDKEIPMYNGLLKAGNLELYKQNSIKNKTFEDSAEFQNASGKLAALLYKNEIEANKRTKDFGGFILLGLQDYTGQQTALVGVVDAFMNSKTFITPAQYKEFAGPVTPLARLTKYTWTNAENFTTDFAISNYGNTDLSGDLEWSMKDESGNIVLSGSVPGVSAPQGALTTPAGTISTSLDSITKASMLTLELSIGGHKNHYTIWVYPSQITTAVPEGVTVSKTLDANALKVLSQGGNVLILPQINQLPASSTFTVKFENDFWSPMFHSGGINTLGALVRKDSKAFAYFPTDNFNDFQWWNLMGKGIKFDPDKTPADFKPLVQPIPTIDQGNKYGTIFEAKVGNGNVLVAAIDLQNASNTKVEAKQLLNSLQTYAASDDFNPESRLDAQYLSTLLPPTTDKLVTSVSVTVDNGATEIAEDAGTLTVTSTVQPGDATNSSVIWTVLDPDGNPSASATISAIDDTHAKVTAVRDGVVRIVAAAASSLNISGEKIITIRNQSLKDEVPVKLDVNGTQFTLNTGESHVIKATATYSDATTIDVTSLASYLSSDPAVATVDDHGVIRPAGDGEAKISVVYQGLSADIDIVSVAVPVTAVTIDKSAFSLAVDQTRTLRAVVLPENAHDKKVEWTSKDDSIAIVGADGTVKGVAAGTTTIVATTHNGHKTAESTVTVVQSAIPVTGISLDKTDINLQPEEKELLKATILPDDATLKDVKWTSSNETVAKVNAQGEVTALAEGLTTITVTTEDGGKTAASEVKVVPGMDGFVYVSDLTWTEAKAYSGGPTKDISLKGGKISLSTGNSTTNQNYIYNKGIAMNPPTANNPAYVTYDISGRGYQKFTADVGNDAGDTGKGNIQFQVKVDGETKFDSGVLTKNSAFQADKQRISIDVAGASQLQLLVLDGGDGTGHDHGDFADAKLTGLWATNDAKLSSVTVNGAALTGFDPNKFSYKVVLPNGATTVPNVTAVTFSPKAKLVITAAPAVPGATLIVVTAENEAVKEYTLNFGYSVPLTGYQFDSTVYNLKIGASQQASISAVYGDGSKEDITSTAAFQSAHPEVAAISSSGLITAVSAGESEIIATLPDSTALTARITVVEDIILIPTTGITLNQVQLDLTPRTTGQLTAEVLPENATNKKVVWFTSNGSVALVNAKGMVTAIGEGTAVITARTADGYNLATANVTVGSIAVTGVTLNQDSLILKAGSSGQLIATVQPDNASNKAVTWSSSDENIATVNAEGWVTAVAEGTAVITVTTVNGGFTATSTVTVSAAAEYIPVLEVSLDHSELTLQEGDISPLTASINPADATNQRVSWSSSNDRVAAVSSNGVVTAVGAGTATITVTTQDGSRTAAAEVMVKGAIAKPSFSITSPDSALVRNGAGGIRANADITLIANEGAENIPVFVIFQLMKGDEPVSIVAMKRTITSSDSFTALFNVNPKDLDYRVKVFVVDQFSEDLTTAPVSFAVPMVIN